MSKTITKLDLVNHLHQFLGLSKTASKELIESFFKEIKNSLINNEEVKLSGFGNFKLIDNEVAKNIYEIDEQKIIANDRYIHTLTQKIIELACGIRDRYGYTSIHIKYKNGLEPDLTNQDWFNRNYYQMYHKLGNNFINKLDNINFIHTSTLILQHLVQSY